MKKFLIVILVIVIGLGGIFVYKNYNQRNKQENIEEEVNIYEIDFAENQGVTREGIILDETLVLNGYEFTFGGNIDDFIQGTGTIVKDMEELNEFKAELDGNFEDLDCYIKEGENTIEFEITVGHDDNNNTVIRGINVRSDAKYADDDFLENPNLVTCGFSFLGGFDINKPFTDLPKNIIKEASYSESSDSKKYDLSLKTKRGDYYKITISASTKDLESDYFYIDYVIATSIAY